jgi:PAS domain-containing protein
MSIGVVAFLFVMVGGLAAAAVAVSRLRTQLRATTESSTIALASAGIATFDVDVASDTVVCSGNYFEFLSIPETRRASDRAGFLGRVHPEDLHVVVDSEAGNSGDARTYQREYRIAFEDGTVRWISEKGNLVRGPSGEVTRIIGAMIDVTDLKDAEAALQAAEDRLARAVRGAQDALWEFNAADRTFWCTPRFPEMLGYDASELDAKSESFMQLIHPDERARICGINRGTTNGCAQEPSVGSMMRESPSSSQAPSS